MSSFLGCFDGPHLGVVTCYWLLYITYIHNANMRRKMITTSWPCNHLQEKLLQMIIYNLSNIDYVTLSQGNEFLYLAQLYHYIKDILSRARANV